MARNPLNGARLKNTTGKHLLAGPLTVLDSTANATSYAGDASIDDLPPGQERLLSYGIDLQVLVDATKNTSESLIQTGKIVKGVLTVTRKNVFTPGISGGEQGGQGQDADRRAPAAAGVEAGQHRTSRSRRPRRSTASRATSPPARRRS